MKLNFNLAAVLLFVTLMLSNCYNTNENLSARQTEPSCEDLTNWKNDGTKHNTYLANLRNMPSSTTAEESFNYLKNQENLPSTFTYSEYKSIFDKYCVNVSENKTPLDNLANDPNLLNIVQRNFVSQLNQILTDNVDDQALLETKVNLLIIDIQKSELTCAEKYPLLSGCEILKSSSAYWNSEFGGEERSKCSDCMKPKWKRGLVIGADVVTGIAIAAVLGACLLTPPVTIACISQLGWIPAGAAAASSAMILILCPSCALK